jgi:hypothetical protein
MKIASVQANAVKIPRRDAEVAGTARLQVRLRNGSAMLSISASAYRFLNSNRTIYSTHIEALLVRTFFEARALNILQPDVGRTGFTEGRKIASLADVFYVPVALLICIGLGPQISAALPLAEVCSNLLVTECNQLVNQVTNRFLDEPIDIAATQLRLPEGAGLGVTPNPETLREFIV